MVMKEVTQEEFFATVGQMNVHPRPERDASYWELPNRQLMGKTTPGYPDVGREKPRYFVAIYSAGAL